MVQRQLGARGDYRWLHRGGNRGPDQRPKQFRSLNPGDLLHQNCPRKYVWGTMKKVRRDFRVLEENGGLYDEWRWGKGLMSGLRV